jgi:YbgC/YbaW family acyl-CoA thioester hydrolase
MDSAVMSIHQPPKIYHNELRVQFEDCDLMGVVYHPNYLNFIERSRTAFMRESGIPFQEMVTRGFGMVIKEIHARYYRPARYEDLIHVYTRQRKLSGKEIHLEQFITQEAIDKEDQFLPIEKIKGRIFCADMHLVCIQMSTMRSTVFPEFFTAIFSPLTCEIC